VVSNKANLLKVQKKMRMKEKKVKV